MAARVLDPATAEVQLPQWRKREIERPAPASPPREVPRPENGDRQAATFQAKLARLSTEMEAKVAQARQAAFHEGEAAGRQAVTAQVDEVVARLAVSVDKLANTRHEVIHRAEEDVVRLSTEIARRILHRELSLDRSALTALIQAALSKLESQEVYRVRTCPDHEELLRRCLEESGRGGVEVIADPSQPLGGAVF
jgi:flagellar biosynthesis/type III secretory pathway protein FliH